MYFYYCNYYSYDCYYNHCCCYYDNLYLSILIVSLQHFPIGFLGDGIPRLFPLWHDHNLNFTSYLITNFLFLSAWSLSSLSSDTLPDPKCIVGVVGCILLCFILKKKNQEKKDTHKKKGLLGNTTEDYLFFLDAPKAPFPRAFLCLVPWERTCCWPPTLSADGRPCFYQWGNLFVNA